MKGGFDISKISLRVNKQITETKVRLVSDTGEQIGVVPLVQALEMAQSKELDLVEVAPQAEPPVCKILDYSKYKFERHKKPKQSKKKQHVVQIKMIRLHPNIGAHDLEVKVKHIKKFLGNGDKVKIMILFRGREVTHKEIGKQLMDNIIENLAEISNVEQSIKMEGKSMSILLTSTVKK